MSRKTGADLGGWSQKSVIQSGFPLSHHLLPVKVNIIMKLGSGARARYWTQTLGCGMQGLSWHLNHEAKCQSLTFLWVMFFSFLKLTHYAVLEAITYCLLFNLHLTPLVWVYLHLHCTLEAHRCLRDLIQGGRWVTSRPWVSPGLSEWKPCWWHFTVSPWKLTWFSPGSTMRRTVRCPKEMRLMKRRKKWKRKGWHYLQKN